MPDLENLRVHLTMRVLALILCSALGMTVTATAVVVNVQRDVVGLRGDLEAGIRNGREQREILAQRAAQLHQQQQAEIDRVRLEQQANAVNSAEMRESQRNILAMLTRLDQRVEQLFSGRPGGR